MKIAQITATFPPYMGGTGNVCYNYALELASQGHDVTVYTVNYRKENFNYPGSIKVKKLNYILKIGNAPLLLGLFTIKDYDIIHLHYPFFFGGELIYAISKIRNTKYIITYHNDTVSSGMLGLLFKLHNSTIMKLILNNAEKICVTSLDYYNHSHIANLRKDDSVIIETPNGVDIDVFNPEVDHISIRKKYGLINEKIVLFVGGLDKPHFFKGVDYLIKSISKIKNENIRLIIVGDGDLKEQYIDIAEKEGVGKYTIFAGRVSNEDLPKYYAASDLTVLPSTTMGEAFGMVLIEAMATGKPVVASNLPGIRTVVDDGVNGYLVEPKNIDLLASKIQHLLNNPELCRKFGINGRKKVEEKYTWEKIVKTIEKTYMDVLK